MKKIYVLAFFAITSFTAMAQQSPEKSKHRGYFKASGFYGFNGVQSEGNGAGIDISAGYSSNGKLMAGVGAEIMLKNDKGPLANAVSAFAEFSYVPLDKTSPFLGVKHGATFLMDRNSKVGVYNSLTFGARLKILSTSVVIGGTYRSIGAMSSPNRMRFNNFVGPVVIFGLF